MRVRIRAMCVRLHVKGFVRLAILECSDHPYKRTGGCMRDDTHHGTSVFPILPDIIKP